MLYIIRHGRTDWNDKCKLQGQTDIPLNEKGREMAVQAGRDCSELHFDICYCSPLVRARETAEIMLKGRNIPIISDERLLEVGFGIYEGTEKSLDIPDCPINVFFTNPEKYTVPVENGESMEQLYKRVGSFIEEVVTPGLRKGLDILVVGHGAMNACFVNQFKGRKVEEFWNVEMENCKLVKLA